MNLIKSKKFMLIGGISAAVVIAAVVTILILNRQDTYRIVKVFEVDGQANVVREDSGDLDPYANMLLISGDHVSLDKGTLNLKADEDKFIYLEEQTELVLHATGNSENSKTKIDLIRGAITNEIQNKLIGDSSYEINTPNSTMSVRGTIFYVSVYEENGVKYTKVVVFNGEVTTRLVYKDGTMSDKEVSVGKGSEVTIFEDETQTDYVGEPNPIVFEDLPESILLKLRDMIEKGEDVSITDPEIEIILNGFAEGKSPEQIAEELEEFRQEDGEGDEQETDDPDQLSGDPEGEEDPAMTEGGDGESNGQDEDPDGDDPGQGDDDGQKPDQQNNNGDTTDPNGNEDQNQNNGQSNQSSSTATVTFMYKGSTFGTQSVEKGSKATEPSLSPAGSGSWDFNFDKTIEGDTTINWQD